MKEQERDGGGEKDHGKSDQHGIPPAEDFRQGHLNQKQDRKTNGHKGVKALAPAHQQHQKQEYAAQRHESWGSVVVVNRIIRRYPLRGVYAHDDPLARTGIYVVHFRQIVVNFHSLAVGQADGQGLKAQLLTASYGTVRQLLAQNLFDSSPHIGEHVVGESAVAAALYRPKKHGSHGQQNQNFYDQVSQPNFSLFHNMLLFYLFGA